jgi:hypothetical protein
LDLYSPTIPAAAELPSVKPEMEGCKIVGVVIVGLVEKTVVPVPVFVVRAEARLADEGATRNDETPVPNPDTPVEIGKPVQFVSVPAEGVPILGPTSVGVVALTTLPVPVGVFAHTAVSVPAPVTGVPDTVKSAGRLKPTLETVPVPLVTAVMTPSLIIIVEPSGCTMPSEIVEATGRCAADTVPEDMLLPLVVSIVAEGANAVPLVLVTVSSPVDVSIVPSPLTVKPPKLPPELY